jgi:hypothetical protein
MGEWRITMAKKKPSLWMSMYHHKFGVSVGILIADTEGEADDKFHAEWLNDGLEEGQADEYYEVFPATLSREDSKRIRIQGKTNG